MMSESPQNNSDSNSPPPSEDGPKNEQLAVASLIIGVIGLLFSFCCGLFAIPFPIIALILGFMALNKIKSDPKNLKGKEMAIAGMALGGVTLFLVVIIFVFAVGVNLATLLA